MAGGAEQPSVVEPGCPLEGRQFNGFSASRALADGSVRPIEVVDGLRQNV